MHMTPQELRRRWEVAKEEPAGSAKRIEAHQELAVHCPAFVPNLLALGRSLQLNQDEASDAQACFAEGERALRNAVDVSHEDVSALIELAHFLDVIRDSPAEAESLFAEAARRASKQLEEAWAGLISTLGEQEKLEAALAIAKRAQYVFPDSATIAEAIEFAKQSSAG